jgi:hypothetical protein
MKMNDDYITGWATELADNDFDDEEGESKMTREQKIEMYKTSIKMHLAAGDFDFDDDN